VEAVKILVLDDNRDALLVIESFLKTLDHAVSAFTDPQEALLWLKDVKPEFIIADLDMPEMSGYDFVKRVRCYSQYAATQIVCVTGTEATDDEILAGGFSAILRKPVTLSDLMDAVDNAGNPAQPAAAGPRVAAEAPTMAALMGEESPRGGPPSSNE
jgi:CheY-like chemotaxis protein